MKKQNRKDKIGLEKSRRNQRWDIEKHMSHG